MQRAQPPAPYPRVTFYLLCAGKLSLSGVLVYGGKSLTTFPRKRSRNPAWNDEPPAFGDHFFRGSIRISASAASSATLQDLFLANWIHYMCITIHSTLLPDHTSLRHTPPPLPAGLSQLALPGSSPLGQITSVRVGFVRRRSHFGSLGTSYSWKNWSSNGFETLFPLNNP